MFDVFSGIRLKWPISVYCYYLVIISAVVLIGFLFFYPQQTIYHVTWNFDPSNIPDFTEVLGRSRTGNPYDLGSTYLPFVFLMFKPLTVFDSNYYAYMTTMIISYGVMTYEINKHIKNKKLKFVTLALLFISVPSLWIFERGNIIYLCVMFIILFFSCHGSAT